MFNIIVEQNLPHYSGLLVPAYAQGSRLARYMAPKGDVFAPAEQRHR